MTQVHPTPHPPGFHERTDAAAQLAERLRPLVDADQVNNIMVIGLACGGVIVAAEIARLLGLRQQALFVRKIGAPSQPELAIGAMTASGDRVLNTRLIQDPGLTDDDVDRLADQARANGLRLTAEAGISPQIPDITGKVVILTDDGLATGATMRVSIESAYRQGAGKIAVSVPVAPTSMLKPFEDVSDNMITVVETDNLDADGQWYRSFTEVSSQSVRAVLPGTGPA